MNTTMDSLVIDIQSTSTDATQGIDSLIQRLTNLRDILKEVSTVSSGLSNLKNIGSNVKTARTSKKVEQIEQPQIIAKNIEIEPIFEEMAGQIMKVDSSASQLQTKLDALNVDLGGAKIISTFSNLNTTITKYRTTAGSVVTVTDKIKNGFNKVDVSVKKVNPTIKTFSDMIKSTSNIMNALHVKMLAIATSTVMLIRKIGSLINIASDEAEALNLFTVTMGKYAQEGLKWIEKFSSALYLDPVQVMQYMGSFNSLIKGLGVGADNAYKMSQNLTQLVYDLSSFKNITIQSAYEKIMSGISGELEPLRNVGVAMSEATLQTLAYELGIEKLVRNMTEAEKAQLRYIQIMRSSKEWQTDMGRTLIQPANALRIMRQQFTLLGRAIGKVFIPLLMKAMPYVIAFTQIVTSLAESIAKFFGYDVGDIFDYSDLGDVSDVIDGIGDSADETAKKLNTMLAPFDDLNVVQKESEKTGSGLGGIGGDLGVDLPIYDALAKLNEEFAKGAENAKKKLEDIIPTLLTIGGIMLGWKIAKSVVDFFTFWDKIGLSATKVIGLTLGIAGISMILQGTAKLDNEETFWEGLGLKLGGTLAIAGGTYMFSKDIGITLYVTGISLILQGVKDMKSDKTMWLGIGEALGGSVSLGMGTFMLTKNVTLSLAVTAVGIWLSVGAAIKDLIDLKPTWQELSDAINEVLGGIPYGIVDAFYDASKAVDEFLINTFNSIGEWWDNLKTDVPKKWDEFWVDIGNKFDTEKKEWSENWSDFKETISGMWNIMTDDVEKSWDDFWVNTGNTLDENKKKWSEKFNDIKTSISTTWDETWVSVGNTLETKWNDAKTWFSDNIGTKDDWKKTFNTILDGAKDILDKLKNKFENWKAKIKTPHFEWDSKNGYKTSGVIKKALEALNLPTSIPKLKVNWYQEGGYPTSGDLFFANENGIPEMVGRIGNQTAVANNDQIATSLTNALLSALNQYDFGGGKSPTTIYIGNRKVYEGYGDYVADENDRYGTNMIKI